jgi:hypothetical protein
VALPPLRPTRGRGRGRGRSRGNVIHAPNLPIPPAVCLSIIITLSD